MIDVGGYITKPRGEPQTMWNAGSTPTGMIEAISRGASRDTSGDRADLTTEGLPPLEAIATLVEGYGLRFDGPSAYRNSSPATA